MLTPHSSRAPPGLDFAPAKSKSSEVSMKTTYLVWKDPACNGVNPEWLEITGQEFYILPKQGRYFIKLASTEPDGSDGAIVMESTKAVYVAWRKEKRHSEYLRDSNPGYTQISYHAIESEDGCYGEEFLPDAACDIEADFLKRQEPELLREALSRLCDDERRMIEYLYLADKPGTVRGYSDMTGIPQKTVNDRKTRAIDKLKKYFSE
jgi:RNA polymerase sigma factor (sigma-70 family)